VARITPYALKDIFSLDEMADFYNVQPKGTLAFKGQKFEAEKRHKDKVTVILMCSADGNAKVCPFIANKCEKPHCLRVWRIIHFIENHTNMYGGARRLFFELLVSFKGNLALLIDKCAAHSDVGITLQCVHASSTCCQTPPVHVTTVTKHHLPYETSILQACSTLL